jgi:hypothetical protein
VMFGFYAPFDLETVGRLGELRAALAAVDAARERRRA